MVRFCPMCRSQDVDWEKVSTPETAVNKLRREVQGFLNIKLHYACGRCGFEWVVS